MPKYDFHDPVMMGKAMKKICEKNLMYYVDCDRNIRLAWNKQWVLYEELAERFPNELSLQE